ncbi:hypothetical protein [Persephonella sp.]
MAKRGRKVQKKTSEVLNRLRQALSIDATVEEACFYAGITKDTYYRWIKEDKELADELEGLRNKPVLKARETVVKSLGDPNWAFKYLEKKRRKEFGNYQEIDLKGKVENTQDLNDKDIERIAEKYEQDIENALRKKKNA